MNIKAIKIDANGKSKEEIKKEILEQVEKQFDETYQERTKKQAKIEIKCLEDSERNGYNVHTDLEGDFNDVCEMATSCVCQLVKSIDEDNPILFLQIMTEALKLYLDVEEDQEEEEE